MLDEKYFIENWNGQNEYHQISEEDTPTTIQVKSEEFPLSDEHAYALTSVKAPIVAENKSENPVTVAWSLPAGLLLKQKYSCYYCNEEFGWFKKMKEHRVQHLDSEGNYPCKHCDEKTTSMPKLRKHMEKHGIFKKFLCYYCDKGCNNLKELQKHRKTHVDKKGNFPCKYCDKKESSFNKISKHIDKVHFEAKTG